MSSASISSKRRSRIRFRYCCDDIKNRVEKAESNNDEKSRRKIVLRKSARSNRADNDADQGTTIGDDDIEPSYFKIDAKTKRKAQNREAQRAFRERREQLVDGLQKRIQQLEERKKRNAKDERLLVKENASLLEELKRLKKENTSLKRIRSQHASEHDDDHSECSSSDNKSCPTGKCHRKRICNKKSPREPVPPAPEPIPISSYDTSSNMPTISLFDDLFNTLDLHHHNNTHQHQQGKKGEFIDPILISESFNPPFSTSTYEHNNAHTQPKTILDQWLADISSTINLTLPDTTSSSTGYPSTINMNETSRNAPQCDEKFCDEFKALAVLGDITDELEAMQAASNNDNHPGDV